MFTKYLAKMLGPEFVTQKESKARLKNQVLVVIKPAKEETDKGIEGEQRGKKQ